MPAWTKIRIVVFTSDRGLAIGSHGLFGKQNIYDHSMHVPMIFAGPGVPQDRRVERLLLPARHLPHARRPRRHAGPDGSEGQSLVPAMHGAKGRDSLFTAYRQFQRSVPNDRWHLIVYPRINKVQLFEPRQRSARDQGPRRHEAATVERLMGKLKDWQAKLGDKQPLQGAEPLPAEFDFSKVPPASKKGASLHRRKSGPLLANRATSQRVATAARLPCHPGDRAARFTLEELRMKSATAVFLLVLLFAHTAGDRRRLLDQPLSMFRDGEYPTLGYAVVRAAGRYRRAHDASRRQGPPKWRSLVLHGRVPAGGDRGHAVVRPVAQLGNARVARPVVHLLCPAAAPRGQSLVMRLLAGAIRIVLATGCYSYGLWQKSVIVYLLVLINVRYPALLPTLCRSTHVARHRGPGLCPPGQAAALRARSRQSLAAPVRGTRTHARCGLAAMASQGWCWPLAFVLSVVPSRGIVGGYEQDGRS